MSEGKIGDGHAAAMLRLGLRELRNAANPSNESIADTEIGLYGSQTQGEIADARGGDEKEGKISLEELRGYGRDRTQQNEQGKDRGPEQDRGGREM